MITLQKAKDWEVLLVVESYKDLDIKKINRMNILKDFEEIKQVVNEIRPYL